MSLSSPLKMDGKLNAFHVNTKGFCFLCLQHQQISLESRNVRDRLKKYSYRALSRFLRLDYEKIYNFNGTTSGFENILKKTDFSVSLCPVCHVMAASFARLYQDLEVIKMKIRLELEKIVEVMEEAKKERMEKCKKRMVTPNPVDVLNVAILENLRKQTIEKSKPKIKEAVDVKVVLNLPKEVETADIVKAFSRAPRPERKKKKGPRRKIVMISSSSSSDSFISSDSEVGDSDFQISSSSCSSPSRSSSSSEEEETRNSPNQDSIDDDDPDRSLSTPESTSGSEVEVDENFTEDSPPRKKVKIRESPSPDENLTEDSSPRKRPKRKKSPSPTPSPVNSSVSILPSPPKVFSCQYCSFNSSKQKEFHLHIAKEHFASKFSNHKTKELSDGDFEKVVENALLQISKFDDGNSSVVEWTCPECKHLINNEDSLRARVFRHLIYTHFHLIRVKVVQLQESRKSSENKDLKTFDSPTPKPAENLPFSCDKCGVSFSLRYHLRRHQLKNCEDSSTPSIAGSSDGGKITFTMGASSDSSDSGDEPALVANEERQGQSLTVSSIPMPIPIKKISRVGVLQKAKGMSKPSQAKPRRTPSISQKVEVAETAEPAPSANEEERGQSLPATSKSPLPTPIQKMPKVGFGKKRKPSSKKPEPPKKPNQTPILKESLISERLQIAAIEKETNSKSKPRSKAKRKKVISPRKKKFRCNACGKRFERKYSVQRHEKTSCTILSQLKEQQADSLNNEIEVEMDRQSVSCPSELILPDPPPSEFQSDGDDSSMANLILPSSVQNVECKPTVLETFIVENDELMDLDEEGYKPALTSAATGDCNNSDSTLVLTPSSPSAIPPDPTNALESPVDITVKPESTKREPETEEVPKPKWTKLFVSSSPSSSSTSLQLQSAPPIPSDLPGPGPPLEIIRTESDSNGNKEQSVIMDPGLTPLVQGREP